MSDTVHVVILAGGEGNRLWPWSREGRSKQMLPLWQGRSLVEGTIERSLSLVPHERVHLVAMSGILPDLSPCRWIEEPVARDTAPAIVRAAVRIHDQDPSSWILVLPADHRVLDGDLFRQTMRQAIDQALAGPDQMWLFGSPSTPDRSFGFIFAETDSFASGVSRFVEKPDPALAQEMHEKGALHNSGMFLFRSGFLIEKVKEFLKEELNSEIDLSDQIPATSIDHFLISREEFQPHLTVARIGFSWTDIGRWPALRLCQHLDEQGNLKVVAHELLKKYQAPGEPIYIRAQSAHVESCGGRQLVFLGTEPLALESTPDRVVVNMAHEDGDEMPVGIGFCDCQGLICYQEGDVEVSVRGARGGLVAVSPDLVVVASEAELVSDGLRDVLLELAQREEAIL